MSDNNGPKKKKLRSRFSRALGELVKKNADETLDTDEFRTEQGTEQDAPETPAAEEQTERKAELESDAEEKVDEALDKAAAYGGAVLKKGTEFAKKNPSAAAAIGVGVILGAPWAAAAAVLAAPEGREKLGQAKEAVTDRIEEAGRGMVKGAIFGKRGKKDKKDDPKP